MKKTLKKLIAAACAVTMLGCSASALAACGGGNKNKGGDNDVIVPDPGPTIPLPPDEDPFDPDEYDLTKYDPVSSNAIGTTSGTPVTDYYSNIADAQSKQGAYRTYTSVIPSMWNELDSMDNNNSQIMDYLSSAFFEFDYEFDEAKGGKFNADGTINTDAIVDGSYEVKFSAATKLEDWTSHVTAEKLKYTDAQKQAGGYAWKLTLRDDLKWDNGDPITAADFVYSMKQQLDPKYSFQRASSYYNAIVIKGAKDYAYNGRTVWLASDGVYDTFEGADADELIFTLGSATENKTDLGSAVCSVRTTLVSYGYIADSYTAADVASVLVEGFGLDETTAAGLADLEGKSYAEIKADAGLKATWDAVVDWWVTDPEEELTFFVSQNEYPTIEYDGNVGLYADGTYELVICFTSSEAFLKADGSLSYLAAYELASLPLIHQATFEANDVAPSAGQTLYTNTYQTSLASSRSWGPYKLATYQAGKSYTLEKNPYWYGYNMNDNKNQYNITKIECEQLTELETQWNSFLSGQIDSIGIDTTHAEDYRNSKYAKFTPGTYTFSWHLFSGLDTLKQSGRNNGILAIDDFRKALSLAIDREAYAAANTTAYRGAYGYLNSMYYYDVENGGVYRNTDEAKSGLLRAYGYTENDDGTWSLSTNPLITDKTLDEAYETLTGYNLVLAKEYVEKAYTRLTTYAKYYGYDSTKNIQIKFGTSVDNDSTRLEYNYIKDHVLPQLFEGTSLEGKVELVFDASFGNAWSEKFEAGEYELCTSAWGSAAFNPHYFIGAYVDPDNAYTASYWDTESVNMTMKLPGESTAYPGAGKVRTMTIMNWYRCLNGQADSSDKYTYDWGAGKIAPEYRNAILAKLEETVLEQYYSIPTITQNSATLLGAKFSYVSDNYNTFMGYGGMRYIQVKYTDSEWDAYVAGLGNDGLTAEYKTSK